MKLGCLLYLFDFYPPTQRCIAMLGLRWKSSVAQACIVLMLCVTWMYPGNTNTPLFPDLFTDLNPRSIPDTPLPPVPLDSTTSDIDIAWMTPIRYTRRSLYMSIATLLDFVLIKECFLSLSCFTDPDHTAIQTNCCSRH